MDCAVQDEGEGKPVKVILNHKVRCCSLPMVVNIESCADLYLRQCEEIDLDKGCITFHDGTTTTHDVVVGADGIGSAVRRILGINPDKKPANSSCLHANVDTATAVKLGLVDYSQNSALEYWGGHQNVNKIVLSPCNGGKLLSYYCFFPREKGDYASHNWNADASVEELLAPYPDLDKHVFGHLSIGQEIRPWRLWVHEPYTYWQKGAGCIMGDAAHPVRNPHFLSSSGADGSNSRSSDDA